MTESSPMKLATSRNMRAEETTRTANDDERDDMTDLSAAAAAPAHPEFAATGRKLV